MRTAIQVFSLTIGGAIAGVLIYGLGIAIFLSVYIRIYGQLMLANGIDGALYIQNPIRDGFIMGTLAGVLPGLISGAVIGYYGLTSFRDGAIVGFVSMLASFILVYLIYSRLMGNYDANEDIIPLIWIFIALILPAFASGLFLTLISRILSR